MMKTLDLKALELPAEMPKPKAARQRTPRERLEERFYMLPEAWFERAHRCLTSSAQLAIAVRLYRHWLWRKRGTDEVAASNEALVVSDGGGAIRTKKKTLLRLAKAALIQILSCSDWAAPRVRVLDVKEHNRDPTHM
jgi:hypothetical protein